VVATGGARDERARPSRDAALDAYPLGGRSAIHDGATGEDRGLVYGES
jgi:hypothetical protein